jgi:hypothetical protein
VTDRHETAPDEYPLPVVTAAAAEAVMGFIAEREDHVEGIEAAFDFAKDNNGELVMEIGEMLLALGYTDPESRAAALSAVGITHMLLHAQARIDRGLPPVDMTSDEYFLPVVTEDGVSAALAGADERAAAIGMTLFEELEASNRWLVDVQRGLGYPIGYNALGSATQAAEIATVATHAMLREQASIDALNAQFGGGPLG